MSMNWMSLVLYIMSVFISASRNFVMIGNFGFVSANTFGPAIDIVLKGLEGKFKMPLGSGEQKLSIIARAVYAYE